MKIKAEPYTREILCNPVMCFSFPISFAFGLCIYTCFASPSSFTIFFSEFFIFLRLELSSCNIFLLFFIFFAFLRIFVLMLLRIFCKFLWMEKLFSFVSFLSLRSEGETPNVYTKELFSVDGIYWDIIFTSLFYVFFLSFPIFFASLLSLTFRLVVYFFPHILNNNFFFHRLLDDFVCLNWKNQVESHFLSWDFPSFGSRPYDVFIARCVQGKALS